MPESVTIAICTWNRAGPLDRVLDAMRHLYVPAGVTWEVVVVNNNCSDETDAVIGRHAGQFPLRRLFEATPGISHARNRAVVETTSDYILWIDDDAVPDPQWLAMHLGAFRDYSADLVIGKVDPLWENGQPPVWFIPEFRGMFALLDYGDETRLVTDPKELGFNVNMGFRRKFIEEVGAYRLDIGTGRRAGGEDQDLCNRAHAAGKVVVYQPKALVNHMIPASRCTKSFYRGYTWSGSINHLKLLQSENAPKLLGLPRYFLRKNLEYFRKWLTNTLTWRRGKSFYYELKMIRLLGLYWAMVSHKDPLSYTRRVGE